MITEQEGEIERLTLLVKRHKRVVPVAVPRPPFQLRLVQRAQSANQSIQSIVNMMPNISRIEHQNSFVNLQMKYQQQESDLHNLIDKRE
jgi:hypothetical protein